MSPLAPVCTIIVSPRDRFSLLEPCLETLEARTPQPYNLIIVLGGAPEALKRRLQERYGDRATLVFEPHFIYCSQARTIGLRLAKTRLSVCMDGDVFVRPDWLEPLIRCQEETGAGLVVPLMLENALRIHTGGNSLFITKKGGKPFARKDLPYHNHPVFEGTNLKRCRADYGEMHLQLVDTAAALALGIHDERVKEGEELDCGLSWTTGGREIWFEPKSVVVFDFPLAIEDPDDIRLFEWRWDPRTMIDGYRVMHEKWGLDMTELGSFKFFLLEINAALGWLPRLWPSRAALKIDRFLGRLAALAAVPSKAWLHFRAWRLGYYDWIKALEDPRPVSRRVADEIRAALPWPRRGGARGRASLPIAHGARIEIGWEESEHGTGPAASVHSDGREILRIACLGAGRGHYIPQPAQVRRWDIPRRYFQAASVAEQIDEAVVVARKELPKLLATGDQELARACGEMAVKMRELALTNSE